MAKVYAVMGATGQIGHIIVDHLLKEGHHVKAIGRNPQKLEFLKSKGAQVISIESFDQESILVRAFQGVDAVFGMIPPGQGVDDYAAYQDRVGEATKKAIQENSVPYLVNLSSLGAQLPDGTGPIKGLHRQEQRLKSLHSVSVLHIRPTYFMENLMWSIPSIIETNTLKSPFHPQLAFPFVATPDIGMKAANYLDNLNFRGHTVLEFVGPQTLNMLEATKVLGKSIDKPDLEYEQISYEDAKKAMVTSGMKLPLIALLIEMYTAFNEGKCHATQKLESDNVGQITLEQFASIVFAAAYKHATRQKAMI